MTDKKFTDEEIKKALDCCATYGSCCKDCPAYVKVDRSRCRALFKDAVALINRQQAEIVELHRAPKNSLPSYYRACSEEEALKIGYERGRAEAIKEFENLIVNNLIEQAYSRNYLLCLIKEWAKEMTGE